MTAANANRFLQALSLPDPAAPPATAAAAKPTRARGKHIGGHFDQDLVRKFAILRAELDVDNSELIKRAIEELFARENARRTFGGSDGR
jgi:hypothetical protein